MSIPEGNYVAKATSYDFGMSKGGNEQVGVAFTISQGDHAGQMLSWYGFFNSSENTERALKALRAAGWNGDDLSNLIGLGDTEVQIVVKEEEYNGKTTTKIAWVNALGVAMASKMSDQERKAFAARMKGAVLASKAPAPAAGKPASNGAKAKPKSDEIVDPQAGDDFPF